MKCVSKAENREANRQEIIMGKTKVYILCGLGFLGLLSIVCQGIGLFYPTWMTFSMSLDVDRLERTSGVDLIGAQDMDLDVNMGLWTINACILRPYDFGKQCGSVSTPELQEMMSSRPSDMNTQGLLPYQYCPRHRSKIFHIVCDNKIFYIITS